MNWNEDKNFKATLLLNSKGPDAVFGEHNPFHINAEFFASYRGKIMQTGSMRLTGSSTKDNLAIAALAGTNDRAYLYLFNSYQGPKDAYVKVGLRSAWDTDSASGDWFAVLPKYGQLFIPISDMQSIDLQPNDGNPIVEYILLQKDIN